jgi:hypothetical protein
MALSRRRVRARSDLAFPLDLPAPADLAARALEERRLAALAARFGLEPEDLPGEPASLVPSGLRAPARAPGGVAAYRLSVVAGLAIVVLAVALWIGWRFAAGEPAHRRPTVGAPTAHAVVTGTASGEGAPRPGRLR